MRRPAKPQSALRRPLNAVLASEGNVRVLRELLRHGGELGAIDIAARAGLSPQHVRVVLANLASLALVDELGFGRTRLYRVRPGHVLAGPLGALFEAEEERFEALRATIRDAAAAARPRPLAVWLYGSAARGEDTPESDVDVAVIAEEDRVDAVTGQMRKRLRPLVELGVVLHIIRATPADVEQALAGDPWWQGVVRDAVPIVGPDPRTLLAGLRQKRHKAAA